MLRIDSPITAVICRFRFGEPGAVRPGFFDNPSGALRHPAHQTVRVVDVTVLMTTTHLVRVECVSRAL